MGNSRPALRQRKRRIVTALSIAADLDAGGAGGRAVALVEHFPAFDWQRIVDDLIDTGGLAKRNSIVTPAGRLVENSIAMLITVLIEEADAPTVTSIWQARAYAISVNPDHRAAAAAWYDENPDHMAQDLAGAMGELPKD